LAWRRKRGETFRKGGKHEGYRPVQNFFRWIRDHPRIRSLFGTGENVVKIQEYKPNHSRKQCADQLPQPSPFFGSGAARALALMKDRPEKLDD